MNYGREPMQRFSPKLLIRAREAMGLSQSELSDLSQIPLATIRSWEQGITTDPSVLGLAQVAHSLGVQIEDLLKGQHKG
jgi:transcriptional regulator with XRE-family HTH domain